MKRIYYNNYLTIETIKNHHNYYLDYSVKEKTNLIIS